MADWEERERDEARELYFCECGRAECREKVELTKASTSPFAATRSTSSSSRGHEYPDVETVVEEHDGWVTVRKDPEVADQVRASDPRTD